MTHQENQLLDAFRKMDEIDRDIMLDFAETRALKNTPTRPRFKLIEGSNSPQTGVQS